MTDDLARETARRVLEAAMNHGDAEAGVRIISEAMAVAVEGERERLLTAMEEWKMVGEMQHEFGNLTADQLKAGNAVIDVVIAAIREEPQHD